MNAHDVSHYHLDKEQVRASFSRAAADYESAAILQREVGERMLQRLELVLIEPQCIVDVGAGPGTQTRLLSKRYEQAHVVALDLAEAMLHQLRANELRTNEPLHEASAVDISCVCGDAESLPYVDGCADMVFSNLALQWCNDQNAAFREFRRILKPGGLLMFSTLGPDTLEELRYSWSKVDGYNHVNAFFDMHDLGDALQKSGFSSTIMDVEQITLTYKELRTLFSDLKTIGAHNVSAGRPKGLMGKARMNRLFDAYEQFRKNGLLPATYEVIYGHTWAANEQEQASSMNGEYDISMEQFRRQLKRSG
ncbi:MAG: malonyl-ACP O-methyltransferase BioC [Gammaproteobacteria bacterium]|nr:malonyl-ACP O-methyltransferase BioC [Gammaproteobacteria bacterium]